VQILTHFLRIRVQPIQARSSHLWLYSGAGDAARISEDLPVDDLEILVCRFTFLSKKDEVPASCRVKPFSGAHALPAVSSLLEILVIFSAELTFHNLTHNLFVKMFHNLLPQSLYHQVLFVFVKMFLSFFMMVPASICYPPYTEEKREHYEIRGRKGHLLKTIVRRFEVILFLSV
jgi:hypothetical protein